MIDFDFSNSSWNADDHIGCDKTISVAYCLDHMHELKPHIVHIKTSPRGGLRSQISRFKFWLYLEVPSEKKKVTSERETSTNALIDTNISDTTKEDNFHSFDLLLLESVADDLHGGDEARHSHNSESDRRCSTYIDRQSLTHIDRQPHTSIDRHQPTTPTFDKVSTSFSHQGRDRSDSIRDLQSSGINRRET
ncbi:hypothetical protein YC2023_010791 [Brassica napus]